MFIELPPTGTPAIDLLQQAQLIADTLPTTEQKISKMTEVVNFVGKTLLEQQLFCSAQNFYAMHPEEENVILFDDLTFMAKLDHFAYLAEPTLLLDSLVMTFERPEVLNVAPEEAPSFRRLSFRIPILSVDSCTVFAA